jgi:hypothetical protein
MRRPALLARVDGMFEGLVTALLAGRLRRR